MKKMKLLLIICMLVFCIPLNNLKANKVENNIVISMDDNYYVIGKPTVYFVNRSGTYSISNMDFTLVKDAVGKLYIAYTNKYGKSYHSVVRSGNPDFIYAFYVSGWFYFN